MLIPKDLKEKININIEIFQAPARFKEEDEYKDADGRWLENGEDNWWRDHPCEAFCSKNAEVFTARISCNGKSMALQSEMFAKTKRAVMRAGLIRRDAALWGLIKELSQELRDMQ